MEAQKYILTLERMIQMEFKTIWHLSDSTYNKLKWVVTVFAPLLITFLAVLFETLNVANGLIAITILTAFTTMLGGFLQKSSIEYNKPSGGDSNGSTKA